MSEVLERAKFTLEEGILLKFKVLRTRQLEMKAAEQCYQNDALNFEEAQKCENFLFKNDFKLNAINNFFSENTIRHVKAHQTCLSAAQGPHFSTVAEKDKAYQQCHNDWVRDFKNEKVFELEVRARQLLGSNLE